MQNLYIFSLFLLIIYFEYNSRAYTFAVQINIKRKKLKIYFSYPKGTGAVVTIATHRLCHNDIILFLM